MAEFEKERRAEEKGADPEREGRELQEELDGATRRTDIGAAFVWFRNAPGDRVAIICWPMRLWLRLEGLAQQLGVPRPWINRGCRVCRATA